MKSVYKMPTIIGMKTMCHMTTKWMICLVICLIYQTEIVCATFNTTFTFGTVYNTTTYYNFEILNNVVTTVDTSTPMLLNMDQNDTFLAIFGGQGGHYIGLTADGKSLVGYGDNELGQLGLGNQILAVDRWTSIVNVSIGIRLVGVGYSHSLFLTNDNQLFIMGSNDYGGM
jgi:alpha-tubulin suppressor-like RCC1 family protein